MEPTAKKQYMEGELLPSLGSAEYKEAQRLAGATSSVPKIDTSNEVTTDELSSQSTRQDVMSEISRLRTERQRLEQETADIRNQLSNTFKISEEEERASRTLSTLARAREEELKKAQEEGVYGTGLAVRTSQFASAAEPQITTLQNELALGEARREGERGRLGTLLQGSESAVSRLGQLEKDLLTLDRQSRQDAIADIKTVVDFAGGKSFDELDTATQNAIKRSLAGTNITEGMVRAALDLSKSSIDIQKRKEEADINYKNRQLLGDTLGVDTTITSSPLYGAIVNVNAGSAEGQQKRDAQRIAQLVSSGREDEAKQLILSRVTSKMSATEREAELDRRNTIDALTDMKSALNEYVAVTGDTNIVSGTIEDLANKIGQTTDPKLAAIKARITQATQKYRNAITGAAWGEQETAEYRTIFPSIKNSNKLNAIIIDTMIPLLQNNERNAIGLFLGGSDVYDDIFGQTSDTVSTSQSETPLSLDDAYSLYLQETGATPQTPAPSTPPTTTTPQVRTPSNTGYFSEIGNFKPFSLGSFFK
jgi:hypothetical protein